MNALERAKLQKVLAEAIEEAFSSVEIICEVALPVFGESAFIHMADAVINIAEAIEDAENYIGAQLDQKTRDDLGI
jgi:hypothetical protein